jgi:hypothetical protein
MFDGTGGEVKVSYRELGETLSGFLTALDRQHNSAREAASTHPPNR